jgi:hypothetical protein
MHSPTKPLHAGTDLAGGGFSGLATGEADLLLLGETDQLHAEGLGHGDLEEMHLEGEAVGELFPGGEGFGDLRVEAGGFVAGSGDVADRDFPFVEGFAAQVAVGGEEGLLGPVEVAALGIELLLHIDEFAVGQEVAESPEEGEGALVDDGMGAAFDEGEFGEGFLGQELLVAEADEPFADLVGRQAEVGGSSFLWKRG